jgi:hypothetical protein
MPDKCELSNGEQRDGTQAGRKHELVIGISLRSLMNHRQCHSSAKHMRRAAENSRFADAIMLKT